MNRMMKSHYKITGIVLALILSLAMIFTACAPAVPATPAAPPLKDIASDPLSVTILHTGDSHSYVMPHDLMLKLNGRDTLVPVGGYSLLASAVDDIRGKEKNVMLLSAGDVTEGTIWMPKFEGLADFAAINALKYDAVVLGNHEFASGTQLVKTMVDTLDPPVLAANMDLTQEPEMAAGIKPYVIREQGGQKIGVIGLITPDTPGIARPGNTVAFLPSENITRKYISELNGMGVNKIVILSHLGYEPDLKLAAAVPGIDIIVGGHSHTFMGGPEFVELGLNPVTPYPTVVTGPDGDKVLIVHAWESNQLLGQIKLDFDDHGRISSYSGQPFIYATDGFKLEDENGWSPVVRGTAQYTEIVDAVAKNQGIRIYESNPEMEKVLKPYADQVAADLNAVVGTAEEDLIRGHDTGPGPIIADAFLWSAQKVDSTVNLALFDTYDVDYDIFKGPILANDINMVLDLRHNLSAITLKGSLLKMMLEMGLNSHIKVKMPPPCFELAGFKMTIDMNRKSGERITDIQVRNEAGEYVPMNMDADYTLVTTDFLLEKGIAPLVNEISWMGPLGETLIKSFLKYRDLNIKDVDALTDYIKYQKTIKNPTELRTTLIQAGS
ncbi:MAG: 5'-nucleotidase C-terminal domain-containing protein [Dehalococcoidia bacterium]|nr:5'-nucleotidase C-terminal domain-containing protein [Dehalococcoidia bacterium]